MPFFVNLIPLKLRGAKFSEENFDGVVLNDRTWNLPQLFLSVEIFLLFLEMGVKKISGLQVRKNELVKLSHK